MLAIRAAPMFALALAGALALAAPAYADATADLFAAAKGGTASEVRAALSAGADPGARDENNNTPLHLAAGNNPAASVIVMLIEGGADPGASDEGGATPLHGAAALNPNPSVIVALIEGGADPHAHGEFSGTLGKMPLLDEVVGEFSALLLEFFAGSIMPLHLAAVFNPAPSVITALIEGGADPGARPKFDMTPLHVAEGEDLTASVLESAMIAAFAGMTPLHLAAMNNSAPSVITALIEGGADPDARNEFDFTFTASHATAEENLAASVMVSMIGAMIAVTPLHMAAWHNENPSVITALIEGGADPDARNEFDSTALHAAAEGNLAASVMVSRIEVLFAGRTPLHVAAWHNENPSVITALIGGGADLGARTKSGRTPLHVAAANAAPSVVTALIEGGADPGARDEWGKTPFDYAEDNEALRGTEAYWRLNDGRFE